MSSTVSILLAISVLFILLAVAFWGAVIYRITEGARAYRKNQLENNPEPLDYQTLTKDERVAKWDLFLIKWAILLTLLAIIVNLSWFTSYLLAS